MKQLTDRQIWDIAADYFDADAQCFGVVAFSRAVLEAAAQVPAPVLPKMNLEEVRKTTARNWAREHITTGTPCWCNPETTYKDHDTGLAVVVHKEPQ